MNRQERKGGQKTGDKVDNPQLIHLKRKLEDLEEVHRDGKRAHLTEVESLKAELERSRKVNKGQGEQVARLKKQHDALESRLQDLRSQLSTAQTDARDLRHKLRRVEEERDKLCGKQTDSAELRRALISAEAKRREEIAEKDKHIAELEGGLSRTKDESSYAKARLEELELSFNKELKEALENKDALEAELEYARRRLKREQEHGMKAQEESEGSLEELKACVKQHRLRLQQAAEEFGAHATSSVAASTYEEKRLHCFELQLQVSRLERKLANSEDQVHELSSLIRQSRASEALVSERLQAAEEELRWRSNKNRGLGDYGHVHELEKDSLLSEVQAFQAGLQSDRLAELEELRVAADKQNEVCRSESRQLLEELAASDHALVSTRVELSQKCENLVKAEQVVSKLSTETTGQNQELSELAGENSRQAKEIYSLQTKIEEISEALVAAEGQAKLNASRHEEQLRREKDLSMRLQSSAQQSKMAEDALRAQIEQLSIELAEAEAYQEAYEALAEEMRGIVARNEVAEEEAHRLSQFNAEILSHHNPTQRIFYVDRVRRELAETKQQLALSTQSCESAMAENVQLLDELAMYKSVATPLEGKPRTNMTRVRRIPLAARSLNHQPSIQEEPFTSKTNLTTRIPEAAVSDMTLDELS